MPPTSGATTAGRWLAMPQIPRSRATFRRSGTESRALPTMGGRTLATAATSAARRASSPVGVLRSSLVRVLGTTMAIRAAP